MDESLGSSVDQTLDSLRTNQAELKLEIDQLKEGMQTFSGRLEDSEHILQRTVERDLGQQDAIKMKVDDLSRMVEELDRMVRSQYRHLGLTAPPRSLPPGTTPQASEEVAPAKEPLVPEAEKKPADILLYENALASFKAGDFGRAIEDLRRLVKEFPKSDRADNAHFWIGESYMALREYEQAILAYQDVIKKYPKGNKVPNAMIRQADAFLELKDKTSSRLLLKKVLQNYPKSNEAETARKKLEALK
jgi:tol-pal system protein YbgF